MINIPIRICQSYSGDYLRSYQKLVIEAIKDQIWEVCMIPPQNLIINVKDVDDQFVNIRFDFSNKSDYKV